jgi:hypothetical protein
MPTNTQAQRRVELREPPDSDRPAGPGDALIAKAAAGPPEALTDAEQVDLLAYFLANGELPGDSDPVPVEFMVGEGRRQQKNVWKLRRIGWEEWFDAQERARDEKAGTIDGYIAASYVVARALVEPQLGAAVKRAQQADPENAPQDAAMLLRRMFRKQAGVLLSLSADVRQISRLGGDQVSSRTLDQEVAAGEA